MDARALRCLLVTAVLGASLPAPAETLPDRCELPAADVDPLTDRAGILAQYERLPQPCLRALFAACSVAAGRGLLDFSSAAACSFAYEALLKEAFGGNFRALMAWWRAQRNEPLP